jgi:hypothetical protein
MTNHYTHIVSGMTYTFSVTNNLLTEREVNMMCGLVYASAEHKDDSGRRDYSYQIVGNRMTNTDDSNESVLLENSTAIYVDGNITYSFNLRRSGEHTIALARVFAGYILATFDHNGELHSIDGQPAVELYCLNVQEPDEDSHHHYKVWFEHNRCYRAALRGGDDGETISRVINGWIHWHNPEGLVHRDPGAGPAIYQLDENGYYSRERDYYINGKLQHTGAP